MINNLLLPSNRLILNKNIGFINEQELRLLLEQLCAEIKYPITLMCLDNDMEIIRIDSARVGFLLDKSCDAFRRFGGYNSCLENDKEHAMPYLTNIKKSPQCGYEVYKCKYMGYREYLFPIEIENCIIAVLFVGQIHILDDINIVKTKERTIDNYKEIISQHLTNDKPFNLTFDDVANRILSNKQDPFTNINMPDGYDVNKNKSLFTNENIVNEFMETYGYDYSETYVEKIPKVTIRILTIDKIDEKHIFATLTCSADIDVDCYYEDYDNAVWDSESKSYFFLETKQNKEIHKARFVIRININKHTKEFKLSEFKVKLGEDSRRSVLNISDYNNYIQDIMDMDRENVGLIAMGQYENYLEEMLSNSKMSEELVNRFKIINTIFSDFEDCSIVYDEILEKIKESSGAAKEILLKVLDNKEITEDFLLGLNEANITEDDISKFIVWIEEKYQETSKFDDNDILPECIEFGDQISFSDADDNTYVLSLGELQLNLSEGESEYISIKLSNDYNSEVIKGYIELTVGYVNYDEDGGVADGLADDVEFYYDSIINRMDEIINDLNNLLNSHNKIKEYLENLL